jgi:hypothetical protein
VGRVNRFCMEAFDPFRVSNVLVNVVAVLSCWLSEWIMPNLTKRVCAHREVVLIYLEIDGIGELY